MTDKINTESEKDNIDKVKDYSFTVLVYFVLFFITIGQYILSLTYYDYILPCYKRFFPLIMTTQSVISYTIITVSIILWLSLFYSKWSLSYIKTVRSLLSYLLWAFIGILFFGGYFDKYNRVLELDTVLPMGVGISEDSMSYYMHRYDSLNIIYSKGYHCYSTLK